MPVDLTKPLAWKKADSDELKLLQNLQGHILKHHGREFAALIFFKFGDGKKLESKRLLRRLANFHITSAHRQLLDVETYRKTRVGGGPFCHLALSFKGYRKLGLEAAAPTDSDFKDGMKHANSISALADAPLNKWEAPFRANIHGVLLVADDTEGLHAKLVGSIKEQIEDAGGRVVHVQHGRALRNSAGDGIENFGYVDGRSQPLMLQEDIDKENADVGASRWDPAFPLDTALVPDPGVGDNLSFGSFFVFRKLEQAVHDFKLHEQMVADTLGLQDEDRELAGAMLVGRFEDGTPVTLSDVALGGKPSNNFNYVTDPGIRCPFHGHIRKTNPRGSGGAEAEKDERLHLMPRRGMPYEDVKRRVHPDELPESDSLNDFNQRVAPLLPHGGVGLLFMAFNAAIGKQFKFTQRIWANNANFPIQPPPPNSQPHGIDPVIGQTPINPGDQKLPLEWDNPAAGTNNNVDFGHFVTMKGGEYFFSPSLTFLLNL